MAKVPALEPPPGDFHVLRRYQHTSFMVIQDIEDVEVYEPRGYHPVDIGDTIPNGDDTYTVISQAWT